MELAPRSPSLARDLVCLSSSPACTSLVTHDLVCSAGILNVSRAIDSKTFFSPHQLLLNDTEYRTATKQVVIRNRNTFPMRYTFSSVLAPGIGVYDGVSHFKQRDR